MIGFLLALTLRQQLSRKSTLMLVFLSLLHLTTREKAPVVLLSGSGTAFAIAWLHGIGRKTVLWVDGKAWTRRK